MEHKLDAQIMRNNMQQLPYYYFRRTLGQEMLNNTHYMQQNQSFLPQQLAAY